MGSIRPLSKVDALKAGDSIHILSSDHADDRVVDATTAAAFFQEVITSSTELTTVRAAPTATAFDVQIAQTGNVWLILTPTGSFDDGQITLLASTSCIDKQELLVSCNQAIDSFTIDGNGASVEGEPSQIVANDSFRLRYDKQTNKWIRVSS